MSNRHDVIIWDADVHGAPDGFTEYTYEKAYALIKQPAKPSKKLLTFARDVEKHSHSNDVPTVVAQYFVGFEDDIKAEGTAAYCFSLPEYNWQSIVKILLKEAIKHGLALFDEQIILVLLPNGTILPENSSKSWLHILNAPKKENAFPETLVEFFQLFKVDIGELLANHDFALEAESSEYDEIGFGYVRQTSSVSHKIGFGCAGGDGQFELGYSIQLAEKNMIEIGHKSDFQYYGDDGICLQLPSLLMNTSRFSVDSWESYELFKTILKRSALTWSDTALDIKGLDALLNGNIDNRVKQSVHHLTYIPYALIVARLADNPSFEELAVSLGQFGIGGKSWPAGIRTSPAIAWLKLVQYLRDQVKPIESSINTVNLDVNTGNITTQTAQESTTSKSPPEALTPRAKELPPSIKEELNTYLQQNEALNWPRQHTFTFWLIQDDDELLELLNELFGVLYSMIDERHEAWKIANDFMDDDDSEENDIALTLIEKEELDKYPPIYAGIYRVMDLICNPSFMYHEYLSFFYLAKDDVAQLTEGLRLLSLNQLADVYTSAINSLSPYDSDGELDGDICERQFISVFESTMKYDKEQQIADICEAIRKNYQLFLV